MVKLINSIFSSENPFFQIAHNSKRLTHISLSSFILPIAFLAAAGVVAQFVIAPLVIGDPVDLAPWVRKVFGLYIVFGLGILGIFLWVRFFEGRKIYTLGFSKSGAVKNYLSGFGIGILMVSVVVGIISLLGNIEIVEDSTNITGIDSLGIVLIFLGGFLIQGASEEILSRGWMLQVIGARYWPWLGVLISSLLFAILHLANRGITVLPIVNLVLFGLFMALYVMKDSNLWAVCGWHSSWNWMLGNVYGLSVSGSGERATIFDLSTSGNELISGGDFGPEGSLITTVILIIGMILLIKIILKNKNYPSGELDDGQISTD